MTFPEGTYPGPALRSGIFEPLMKDFGTRCAKRDQGHGMPLKPTIRSPIRIQQSALPIRAERRHRLIHIPMQRRRMRPQSLRVGR
jgi:hypothetical protein